MSVIGKLGNFGSLVTAIKIAGKITVAGTGTVGDFPWRSKLAAGSVYILLCVAGLSKVQKFRFSVFAKLREGGGAF